MTPATSCSDSHITPPSPRFCQQAPDVSVPLPTGVTGPLSSSAKRRRRSPLSTGRSVIIRVVGPDCSHSIGGSCMSLTGELGEVAFSDVIQLCGKIRSSGALLLTAETGEAIGTFWFENGELVDAELGTLEGA